VDVPAPCVRRGAGGLRAGRLRVEDAKEGRVAATDLEGLLDGAIRGIVAAVHAGDVSPRELAEAALARAEHAPSDALAAVDGDVALGANFTWKAGPGTIRSTLRQVDRPHVLGWTGRTLGIVQGKAGHLDLAGHLLDPLQGERLQGSGGRRQARVRE
jgi:hypothetical protein